MLTLFTEPVGAVVDDLHAGDLPQSIRHGGGPRRGDLLLADHGRRDRGCPGSWWLCGWPSPRSAPSPARCRPRPRTARQPPPARLRSAAPETSLVHDRTSSKTRVFSPCNLGIFRRQVGGKSGKAHPSPFHEGRHLRRVSWLPDRLTGGAFSPREPLARGAMASCRVHPR